MPRTRITVQMMICAICAALAIIERNTHSRSRKLRMWSSAKFFGCRAWFAVMPGSVMFLNESNCKLFCTHSSFSLLRCKAQVCAQFANIQEMLLKFIFRSAGHGSTPLIYWWPREPLRLRYSVVQVRCEHVGRSIDLGVTFLVYPACDQRRQNRPHPQLQHPAQREDAGND